MRLPVLRTGLAIALLLGLLALQPINSLARGGGGRSAASSSAHSSRSYSSHSGSSHSSGGHRSYSPSHSSSRSSSGSHRSSTSGDPRGGAGRSTGLSSHSASPGSFAGSTSHTPRSTSEPRRDRSSAMAPGHSRAAQGSSARRSSAPVPPSAPAAGASGSRAASGSRPSRSSKPIIIASTDPSVPSVLNGRLDANGRPVGSSHAIGRPGSRGGSSIKCMSCERDRHGRIKRDPKAVDQFKRSHPKPPGCKDCEVDHIVPLSKGGRDDPSNMQWLSREQHRDKTRRELRP